MTPSPMSSAAFQNILSDRTYDIEFNGYLSNHAKHAVIALYKLDAPASRIQEYWNMYTTLTPYNLPLHRITDSWEDDIEPCSSDEWKELRGRKERWTSMCKFLEQELNASDEIHLDTDKLVARYAPDLLPGLAGSLTHGIIHAGWAVDADSHPWMIIEGLAYMNFCFLDAHCENFVHGAVRGESGPADSMKRVATRWEDEDLRTNWIERAKRKYDEQSGFHPELIPAGFQWELSKVLDQQHEVAYELPAWLDDMSIEQLQEELYKVTGLLYLATLDPKDGHGNFLVLHLITSLWGLEQVLRKINNDEVSRKGLKCFYVVMICLLATSSAGFPSRTSLEETLVKYPRDDIDVDPLRTETEEWAELVRRARNEIEEHNIKLVYVTRELWRRYGYWRGFRKAAEAFTVTPNIGPSATSFKA